MNKDQKIKDKFFKIMEDSFTDVENVTTCLFKELKEGEDTNDLFVIALADYWIAVHIFRTRDRKDALPYALKATTFFKDYDDYEMKARSYNILAVIYETLEEYFLAMDLYQKAYEILKLYPQKSFKTELILNNLASAAYHFGDIEMAISYSKQAIRILKKESPNDYRILYTLGENLSWYYHLTGKTDKVFECIGYMEEAIANGHNKKAEICYYHLKLASAYISIGNYDQGIYHIDKFLSYDCDFLGEHEPKIDYEVLVKDLIKYKDFDRIKKILDLFNKQINRTEIIADYISYHESMALYYDAINDKKDENIELRKVNKYYKIKEKEKLKNEKYIKEKNEEVMQEISDVLNKIRINESKVEKDHLTGLYNREGAEKHIGRALTLNDGCFMLLDLDSFKLVNDIYGHQSGDEVLKSLAQIMQSRFKHGDILCRIGGDEFLVYINNNIEKDMISQLSIYLNTHLKTSCKNMFGDSFNIPIGISIGVVNAPKDSSYKRLFKLADEALYEVKQNGKHGFSIYDKKNKTQDKGDPQQELRRMMTILTERNAPREAMIVGQDVFTQIYHYMERFSIRHDTDISICMIKFKMKGEEGEYNLEKEKFKDHLRQTLRRNDVILDSQNDTLFLMLPDLPEKNIQPFMDRLMNGWKTNNAIEISHMFASPEPMT